MSGLVLPRRDLWLPRWFARVRDDTGKRMRYNSGGRINDDNPSCCCDEAVECQYCNDNPLPATITATLSGFTDDPYTGFNDTWLLYDTLGGCSWISDVIEKEYCETVYEYTVQAGILFNGNLNVNAEITGSPSGESDQFWSVNLGTPDVTCQGTHNPSYTGESGTSFDCDSNEVTHSPSCSVVI